MPTDFSEFVLLAREMIGENGRPVQIQKLASDPADPDKPWKGPGVPTVAEFRDVVGVFVPASGPNFGRNIVKQDLLDRVDEVVLIAPTDTSLEGFHAILDDGVRWGIDWIQALRPGPLTVLYMLGVKR